MKHNNPALCALRRLHADIGGKIIDNRKRAKRLHEDRRYVAAVIRMFSPDYDVKAIPARRRYKVNAWFKRGTLFRFALDVMKGAEEPLTVREIVDRMLATKGVANARSSKFAACNVPFWLPYVIAGERGASRQSEKAFRTAGR